MYAVIKKHVKVVSELILAKADPSLKSNVSVAMSTMTHCMFITVHVYLCLHNMCTSK